jgi:Cof subfamily protein (haloacid dehalogenase superfamily)
MNSRPVRLIALDVDGTLLDSRFVLSPMVRAALHSVADRGVEVVLASARGPSGLRPVLHALDLCVYSVTFSGSLLCRSFPDRPAVRLEGERMDLSAAREVALHARELGVSLGWWEGEDWFVEAIDEVVAREATVIGVEPSTCDLTRRETPPFKLQCMTTLDRIERLDALRAILPFGLTGHFSNPNYLEVLHDGIDKARGLARLGALLDIPLSAMAAMGDGENDITMLSSVGLGVAVANARPAVLAAAAWVTEGNDKDGVAVALARMDREGLLPAILPRGIQEGMNEAT